MSSSRYPERDSYSGNRYQKPRFQEKENRLKSRFGFEYDESKINYTTEIPAMPEKVKHKPDAVRHSKRIDQLDRKVQDLKKQRKAKKDEYKKGSSGFRKDIDQYKRNIDLGKACLCVLNFDLGEQERQLASIEDRISHFNGKINQTLKFASKGKSNVKLEDMTFSELIAEQDRITQRMSTENLNKAQESDLHIRLNKILKQKVLVDKTLGNDGRDDFKVQTEVSSMRSKIENFKKIKEAINGKIADIKMKIECIESDIEDFDAQIEQIHLKQANTDSANLLQEAQQLKQQIQKIFKQMQVLTEEFDEKMNVYKKEQELIKYIKWAQQVKDRKQKQWDDHKEQRKRQRLRQKGKDKETKETLKDGKDGKKAEVTKSQSEYQRIKINRNQKEIDSCAFLIQYCQGLKSEEQKEEQKNAEKKQVEIAEALKQGKWAKQKGVEVLEGKKKKIDEEVEPKHYKKKDRQTKAVDTSDKFSHTFFIAQAFDSVKILPPSKPEDIEKVIAQLEDKMEYYLAHPDQGLGNQLIPVESRGEDREDKRKRGGNRKVINTQQFPSLK